MGNVLPVVADDPPVITAFVADDVVDPPVITTDVLWTLVPVLASVVVAAEPLSVDPPSVVVDCAVSEFEAEDSAADSDAAALDRFGKFVEVAAAAVAEKRDTTTAAERGDVLCTNRMMFVLPPRLGRKDLSRRMRQETPLEYIFAVTQGLKFRSKRCVDSFQLLEVWKMLDGEDVFVTSVGDDINAMAVDS